ncbi:hypothetical protein LguiB_027916 [Lonicera macranthoides]
MEISVSTIQNLAPCSVSPNSKPLTSIQTSSFIQSSIHAKYGAFVSNPLKLGLRTSRRRKFTAESASKVESVDPLIVKDAEKEIKNKNEDSSVVPVYVPTPRNRDLRTPHSGYHFDGSTRKFFEGWYFKVSIPEKRQSFCFMYSVENPAFTKKPSGFELLQHGDRSTGVGAQILGPDDKYICQYTEESHNFWGSKCTLTLGHETDARHELMLGNTFVSHKGKRPPNKEVPPQSANDYKNRGEFDQTVLEGFQVTPLWHQGSITDDGRTDYVEIVKTARWKYSTRPIYGWGNVGSKQKATAGWLAAFPVFEPHWQICMAGGLSTGIHLISSFSILLSIYYYVLSEKSTFGWIEWDGERYEFQDAPSYSEKNWGGAFPRKWFWVQCNVFEGASGEVALTAAGGRRQLPGPSEIFENAAMERIFYEFVPWNGVVNWEVSQWGYWCMSAENKSHKVELVATTKDPGATLRAPTTEAGLSPACRDTCFGDLRLQLWERRYDGSKGKTNMNEFEILKTGSDRFMSLDRTGWFSQSSRFHAQP